VTRRYHLSLPAVSFMVLVILVAILAMNSQNNLLFWLFGAMVALLFVSGLVSGFMMLGLRVHRIDPRQGAVGEPLVVRYRLVNRNRLLPAFNIHVEDLAEAPVPWRDRLRAALGLAAAAPAPTRDEFRRIMKPARAWVMHVGPRETVHGEAIFWPTGRGPVTFDRVRIWTTFPFGLIKKSVTVRQPSRTLIHPRRYEMRRGVLSAVTPPGPLGMRVTPHAGSGDDYYGLREYRPSDSLRHIAWKRTANLDQVVCVEHTRVSPPKLRIALNLTCAAAPDSEGRELEERAISLAASIVHAADAAGFEVGLSILGTARPPLPVRHGKWHLSKLTAALAAIDLDAPREPSAADQLPDLQRVGLVVIHPDRVAPEIGRSDAWHFSARQLDDLTTRPIGWDPRREALQPAETEAAA
jgi:uncharacterized protein (DUF58 family)